MVLSLCGCATTLGGANWGGNVTFSPGWERVGHAALKAAKDPFTWAPLAGTTVMQINNFDNKAAAWANRTTPVFGSRKAADRSSDWLRAASFASYVGFGLGAPVGHGEDWAHSKMRGFAVGATAIGATLATTEIFKSATARARPGGQNDRSFLSGHASVTAVSARLSYETLRYYETSPAARLAADSGFAGLTLLTGWARLEAGKHHPSDVLAGITLGNFIAVFTNEAFLHPTAGKGLSVEVMPWADGWTLHLSVAF